MKMNKLKRVLVVEDIKGLLNIYAYSLEMEGYSVDKSENLDDALLKIKSNTYHVALVDLQLDISDDANRDGLKILKLISDLKEGTQTVVISGQGALEVLKNLYENYRINRYIIKKGTAPSEENVAELISTIKESFENSNIREFGPYDSITKFLTLNQNVLQWEHKCLSFFQPPKGINSLYSFLNNLFKPFTPLLPLKNSDAPMEFDNDNKRLSGKFWSKGIGRPISVTIYSNKSQPEPDNEVLSEIKEFNMIGVVSNLPEYERDQFVEKL